MRIDITQELCGLDGALLKDGDDTLTLRSIGINALVASLDDDQRLSGEDKFELWMLAKRLCEVDTPELKVEEVAKIKERIGKAYSQVVVGPAFTLLEDQGTDS